MEKADKLIAQNLKKASEQIRQQQTAVAIQTLKQVLEMQSDNELALGMLAAIYLQIGMHKKSEEKFLRLLRINPDNPLAQFQLGMLYLAIDKPVKALGTWEPLLADRDNFMVYFHSALAHFQLGNETEAHKMLEIAHKTMPASHPLFSQLIKLMNSSKINK